MEGKGMLKSFKGKNNMEDLGVDVMLTLNRISNK
jgi:hypothetical protein